MREMKDSGIEWIGEIPVQWNLVQTKRFFTNTKKIVGAKADNYDRLALTLNGVIKRSKDDSEGLQPEKFEGYQILCKNELVFKLIDLENVKTSRVGLSPYTGLVSPAYIVLSNNFSDNRFFYHWFMSMYYNEVFNHLGGEGVRSALNAKDVLSLPVPDIQLDEQRRIADYLDRKCSQIDDIIARQQAVIGKLKAYKLSVITEAVTKGLNPDTPMKDSGVEWIGEIPEYWQLSHIGNLVEMGSGGTPDRKKPEYWGNGNIPWMSSGEINDEYIYSTTEHITELGLQNSNAKILPVNTVMLGLIGQGKTKGLTAILKTEVCCNQNLAYLIADEKYLHYRYLFYCFKAMYFYIRGLVGESQAGIYSYFLKKLHIPLPDIEQQIRISDYLDTKCEAIKNSINKRERIIEKFTSYKRSLIYEVVTGKKEVQR